MTTRPIQNFLITSFGEFVQQFRLVILDEIEVSRKERAVFESILDELTNQDIFQKEDIDLDAYGYCEIRRINDQYASLSLSSVNVRGNVLENFNASKVERILREIDGSLFYYSDDQKFSLILTFGNKA